MDNSFDILLPLDLDIKELVFSKKRNTWEGVDYFEGFPECDYSSFKLTKHPTTLSVLNNLPNSYQKINWNCINIDGKGLDDLIYDIFMEEGITELEFKFRELIYLILCNCEKWVIIFEPNFDSPLKVKYGDKNNIFDEMKLSILGNNGFVLCK